MFSFSGAKATLHSLMSVRLSVSLFAKPLNIIHHLSRLLRLFVLFSCVAFGGMKDLEVLNRIYFI